MIELSQTVQFLSRNVFRVATGAGRPQWMPSNERLTSTSTAPVPPVGRLWMARYEISQVWWRRSNATGASLARSYAPAGWVNGVTPGRNPCTKWLPASIEVAQPMSAPPPSTIRPTWKADTHVAPNENVSGSTSDRCWLAALVNGSSLILTTFVLAAYAGIVAPNANAAAAVSTASHHRRGRRPGAAGINLPLLFATDVPTSGSRSHPRPIPPAG